MPRPDDRTFTAGGLRLHALDWGTAGCPPVLLLHGAAQTAHSFDEVAPAERRNLVLGDVFTDRHGLQWANYRSRLSTVTKVRVGPLNERQADALDKRIRMTRNLL